MTDILKDLRDVLEADASRRAQAAAHPAAAPAGSGEHAAPWELRFRLVNTFPRETRPLFSAFRMALAPYGYTLSPLHPPHTLHRPIMQTELARLAPEDARFAPLVFELDPASGSARVYVRQFGGRAAPDFPEQRIALTDPPDLAAMQRILATYIRCMLQTPAAPAA